MNKIRKQLEDAINNEFKPNVIVQVVRLPTGAHEVITNTQFTEDKLLFLANAYNEDMQLQRNLDVRIIGLVIV
jgi:hypothetical protein